ncbi:MAG: ABC transporter substrate-binding protein [Promethearchaeota archaeon]|nr:MAG: ABC transporter substrate-binding protein [Candidatus Lokiarchaeota archaeon]
MEKRKVRKRSKGKIALLFIAGFFIGFISTNFFVYSEEDVTHIYIIYSSEKASWMSIAYADFIEEWNEEHPDEKIMIHMHPYGSSDSMISILNGEIFPTIWSPASSIWMPFLNRKWKEYKGVDEEIVNIGEAVKIIYSPIVIATWEEFNKTHQIDGFQDLYTLNKNNKVTVRMAHTDPRLSNSGFMSTIMALSAAAGKPAQELEMEDLTDEDNQDWLKTFESSAVMYGKSTGFLAEYMKNGGPDTLNVAFLYENLISDISTASEAGRIVAVYPEEGTLYSDHPFCILDADWISNDQRRVAEEFLDFLREKDTVKSALDYGFRPIDKSISLNKEVFNYETNGIAYNLTVDELEVPEDDEALLRIPDLWLLCKATG